MRGEDALLRIIGTLIVMFGSLFTFLMFASGNKVGGLDFLVATVGGGYILYSIHRKQMEQMEYLVAKLGPYNDVLYDDEGLYYDKPNKPYLLKWNEVADYRILDVVATNEYTRAPPIFNLFRYLSWRKRNPEYAMTGIVKIGTVQFIKKDGSSVILQNVLFPYRLVPIFDKYIKGNNQKKGYYT
jgi:hypothetical protein